MPTSHDSIKTKTPSVTFISNLSFCLVRSKSEEEEITNTTCVSHDDCSNLPNEVNVGIFILIFEEKNETIKLGLFLT